MRIRISKKLGILEVLTDEMPFGAQLCTVDLGKVINGDHRPITNYQKWKIASEFNVQFVKPLSLAFNESGLVTVDGTHSKEVLIERGYATWAAWIFPKWTQDDRNKAFYNWNQNVQKLSGWKCFDAAIKAGSESHRHILAAINKSKLTTPIYHNVEREFADLRKCGIVMETYNHGGIELINLWLKAFKNWKTDIGFVPESCKTGAFGRGLYRFLHVQGDPGLRHLRNLNPDDILATAKRKRGIGRVDHTQIRNAMLTM